MQPNPDAVAVANRVREVLVKKQISAAELARRLGYKQSWIARRMTGRVSFSATELIDVANVLGVAPSSFIRQPAKQTASAS